MPLPTLPVPSVMRIESFSQLLAMAPLLLLPALADPLDDKARPWHIHKCGSTRPGLWPEACLLPPSCSCSPEGKYSCVGPKMTKVCTGWGCTCVQGQDVGDA